MTIRIAAEGLGLLAELDEPVQAFHQAQFGALDAAQVQLLIELIALVRTEAQPCSQRVSVSPLRVG